MGQLIFEDEVFKLAIQDLFNLDDSMNLEDLEKIEEIVFYDYDFDRDEEIRFVELKGVIKSLKDLKYFPNLKNLSLNFSDPDNPEIYGDLKDIVHLTKLKTLNMSGSIISGDLSLLKPLKDLELLVLTGVEIKGKLFDLQCLRKLRKINFSDAKFEGCLKDLIKLPNLEKIILGWTNVKGNLEDFKDYNGLKVIDLSCCYGIEGSIKSLSHLKELEDITLAGCTVDGDISSLKDMKNLKILDLASTYVYGDFTTIANLPELSDIDLENSDVENIIVAKKRKQGSR